jgi:acyl carrier protein
MEDKIIQIASEVFGYEITKDSKIGSPENWDSLGHLNLFMAIENELNQKFAPDDIIECDSVEKIVKLIK